MAIEADVEFGGTDQKFNLRVGRELQEKRGMRPQDVFLMPILQGTAGVRRMGKSLGNYIAIEDAPPQPAAPQAHLATWHLVQVTWTSDL